MWSVNLRNSVRNLLYIAKEWHLPPSEILRLPYYEYEWILDEIKEVQKKEDEQRKKDEKNRNNMMPKMPNMNSFKTPSLPKINMPKF